MTAKEYKRYKNLKAWQKAIQLADEVYDATENYPNDEKFGLMSQIRRSAVSVPSNIAEGSERQSSKDFIRFINIAKGSLAELETQLIISKNRDYIAEEVLEKLTITMNEVNKIINFLRVAERKKLNEAA